MNDRRAWESYRAERHFYRALLRHHTHGSPARDAVREALIALARASGLESIVLLAYRPGSIADRPSVVISGTDGAVGGSPGRAAADKIAVSMSVVRRVLDTGRPFYEGDPGIALWPDETGRPGSLVELGLREVSCVPLTDGPRRGVLFATGCASRERAERVAGHAEHLAAFLQAVLSGSRDRDRDEVAEVVGGSEAAASMREFARFAAGGDLPVLLLGPTGAGKTTLARAIHRLSARAPGPWRAVNGGAIAIGTAESLLFGHVRGAFTGADAPRPGFFEQAHGGTLLLDEVAELDRGLQGKLLQVLDTGEVQPLGAPQPKSVDVRLVAATNADLRAEVLAGRFREDLYYRLAVFVFRVPTVAERLEDLPLLAEHALAQRAAFRGLGLAESAYQALMGHDWPGNLRELHNVLAVAASACVARGSPEVTGTDVARALEHAAIGAPCPPPGSLPADLDLARNRDAFEAALVREAMARAGQRQVEAARLLGIDGSTLSRKLRRLRDPSGG